MQENKEKSIVSVWEKVCWLILAPVVLVLIHFFIRELVLNTNSRSRKITIIIATLVVECVWMMFVLLVLAEGRKRVNLTVWQKVCMVILTPIFLVITMPHFFSLTDYNYNEVFWVFCLLDVGWLLLIVFFMLIKTTPRLKRFLKMLTWLVIIVSVSAWFNIWMTYAWSIFMH